MLPALTTIAKLNHRARVDLSIHALQPSLSVPALASSAEFSLQVVAAPARDQSFRGVSSLVLGCELGEPCKGLVPTTSASPAGCRQGCPRVAGVRGACVACNARVERGGKARKLVCGGWKVSASVRHSQCPSLNTLLHGTGRSRLQLVNHRARPPRDQER